MLILGILILAIPYVWWSIHAIKDVIWCKFDWDRFDASTIIWTVIFIVIWILIALHLIISNLATC